MSDYGGSFGPIRKVGVSLPISRELAIEAGLIQPTAAEVERQRQARQKYEADVAVWRGHTEVAEAELAALTGLARAVLDLHSMDDKGDCEGCDYSGWEGDPPVWPCRTVELIASEYDIPMPHQWVAS